MLRLAKILAIVLLLAPISAAPLGLGDIRLNSALNQQFDAEIDMISLGETRVEDITVRLASREAFERAGIDRPLFLSRLQFVVEPVTGNTASIRIRSEQPVKEPFLNFLVEVNWPNGRVLREYTVLLDPPLFLDEAPTVVQAPAVTAAGGTTAPAAGPEVTAAPAAAAPASTVPGRLSATSAREADGAWSYGPVQQSDTLWSIAGEYRAGDDSVSVEQIMMALLRDNPEAFYNGNINELRAGHVLRIDDPATIAMLDHAEAAAEARRQFAQWQDAKQARADTAESRPLGGEEGEVSAATGMTGGAAAEGPRLRLSAPDAADAERFSMSESEIESSASDAAAVSRMREDLVAALEVSESARQENLELRQRLSELEEQISAMQRLMSLQDDTMAALQAGAGSEAVPQPDPVETPETAPTSVQAQAEQPSPPVAVVPPPVIPEGASLIDNILNDPMMLGAAGFLLLMIATLAWLIVRRRQMSSAALMDLPETTPAATAASDVVPSLAPTRAPAAGTAAAAAAGGRLDDAVFDGGAGDGDIGLDIMQADEDEIDILAEADVYLAYRRFDKAEELLRDAIAGDPGRQDLVLKLLEVHAGSGNAEAFVAEAEALRATSSGVDGETWDRIVAMGLRIAPDHPLFSGESAAAAGPEPAAATADATSARALDEVELDFSSELDLQESDLDFTREETTAPATDDNAFTVDAGAGEAAPELTIDDDALAALETGGETVFGDVAEDTAPAMTAHDDGAAIGEPLDQALNADAELVAGLETGVPAEADTGLIGGIDDEDLEKQLLEAGKQGADVDWLAEIGNDLEFEDMEGDEAGGDFSGLISGEDEVGTKLDLARAYIDMGDQDSARSILSEVTEEGNEAQQREASDLMRRIG